MNVIKRIIVSFLSILCLVFTLTGCSKCVNIEYEDVEVTIIDEFYRPKYTTHAFAGGVTTTISHPAQYSITVEYDGVEYKISGSDTYNKYKGMVGQTAIGTLEVYTYSDGVVRYNIVNLE